ncbi:Tetraspanin family-domain-containing protein [Fimicolochytrium jonesii]|uniref:Tetraspanin family-domain-containing protein n=1 Tax=Fimicolochytrium jonesii TaxID=1396493 RepID=UPI0022FE2694|nr:Tetraspanin family-domain-containing protein [Fimicolochytrium jonesii]KAI8824233.1 Tetraspanin family-domain-containing protein [Fimicolochytrium jonesii]
MAPAIPPKDIRRLSELSTIANPASSRPVSSLSRQHIRPVPSTPTAPEGAHLSPQKYRPENKLLEVVVTSSSDADETTTAEDHLLDKRGNQRHRAARPLSGISARSFRSYISNLSYINRKNLARFGKSKLTFLVANTVLTFIGLATVLFGIFTFLNNNPTAMVMRMIRVDLLFLLTLTSGALTIVGLVGFLGAFMHRKNILSIHSVLLWPILAGLIVLGYMAYNQLNTSAWDDFLTNKWDTLYDQRGFVQDKFNCCGFFSGLDRPLAVDHCVPPSPPAVNQVGAPSTSPQSKRRRQSRPAKRQVRLHEVGQNVLQGQDTSSSPPGPASGTPDFASAPGCYMSWNDHASSFLRTTYICAFCGIPLLLFVFIVGLLASNHIYD